MGKQFISASTHHYAASATKEGKSYSSSPLFARHNFHMQKLVQVRTSNRLRGDGACTWLSLLTTLHIRYVR